MFAPAVAIDSAARPRMFRHAGLLLDLDARRALVGDLEVALSPLEFATVQTLLMHRGQPMSKEALGAALPVQVDPRMIDVYIARSRAKLAFAGLDDLITTVWGRGYMIGASEEDARDLLPIDPMQSSDLDATPVHV